MSLALPVRFTPRNLSRATAALPHFSIVATKPAGADRCEVALRGDYLGSFANAKAHCINILGGLVARHGRGCDVQLLVDSTPVFICTDSANGEGGAS